MTRRRGLEIGVVLSAIALVTPLLGPPREPAGYCVNHVRPGMTRWQAKRFLGKPGYELIETVPNYDNSSAYYGEKAKMAAGLPCIVYKHGRVDGVDGDLLLKDGRPTLKLVQSLEEARAVTHFAPTESTTPYQHIEADLPEGHLRLTFLGSALNRIQLYR